MRAVDWGSSPLGHPEKWSSALHTALGIILSSQHPMIIFWGVEHRCFYNDAYARSLGPEEHAVPLGAKGADELRETWDVIGPQVDHVMRCMGATWHENQVLPVSHRARHESSYWTYGYSPIPDPGAPSGIGVERGAAQRGVHPTSPDPHAGRSEPGAIAVSQSG
jgi:hypothetical protein